MSVTAERKQEIINDNARGSGDFTGQIGRTR
jgi:hypothetical protein